jgi:hypothetical protein
MSSLCACLTINLKCWLSLTSSSEKLQCMHRSATSHVIFLTGTLQKYRLGKQLHREGSVPEAKDGPHGMCYWKAGTVLSVCSLTTLHVFWCAGQRYLQILLLSILSAILCNFLSGCCEEILNLCRNCCAQLCCAIVLICYCSLLWPIAQVVLMDKEQMLLLVRVWSHPSHRTHKSMSDFCLSICSYSTTTQLFTL